MKIPPLIFHLLLVQCSKWEEQFLIQFFIFYNVNCLFQEFSLPMYIHFACAKVPDFTHSFWVLLLVIDYKATKRENTRVTLLKQHVKAQWQYESACLTSCMFWCWTVEMCQVRFWTFVLVKKLFLWKMFLNEAVSGRNKSIALFIRHKQQNCFTVADFFFKKNP